MTTLHASTTQPKEGAYVVYLNGIEIPATAASVDMVIDGLPTATVTVAPDMNMVQLGKEDRVEVQIFYKDDIYTAVQGRVPDFRLLFDGTIAGWSYVAAAKRRNIQFRCVHASQILETLNPYFITGPNAMVMSGVGMPKPNQVNLVHSGLTLPYSLFFYGFNALDKIIKRPYDYIENIFRACIDINEAPKLGSVVTSTFYARYMKKLGIPFRFIPSPIIEIDPLSDPDELGAFPILKAVRDVKTIESIYRTASESGLSSNIWSSIQGVFSQMYYEVLSISTAPIAMVEMTPGSVHRGMVIGKPSWKIPDMTKANERAAAEEALFKETLRDMADAIREEYAGYSTLTTEEQEAQAEQKIMEEEKRLTDEFKGSNAPEFPIRPPFLINHVTKPQWLFGIPPACNVIFPSMIQELRFDEDYLNQPTRFYVNDMSVGELAGVPDGWAKALSTLRYGYPDQVERELAKSKGLSSTSGNPLVSGKNFLVWPEEFYKGPVSQHDKPPRWLVYLQAEFEASQTVDQQLARKALDKIEQNTLDLWAEAYSQAQAATDQVPPDSFFVNQEEKLKAEAKLREKFEETLLERLLDKNDVQVMIQKLKEQRILSGDITSVAQLKEKLSIRANESASKIQVLMNMLARYEFHRRRSSMRRGSVRMAFNPYIVPGFPAVIFDYFENGQHFIGYVVGVKHELSSRGWQTAIQFVHGQTLDEFVNEVFDSRVGNNPEGVMKDISAGPPTPIPDLRKTLQHINNAEKYFSQLFHQGIEEYGGKVKTAAFDVINSILFVVPEITGDAHYSFDKVMDERAMEQQAAKLKEEADATQELWADLKARMAVIEDDIRASVDEKRGGGMSFAEGVTKKSYVADEIARAKADQVILLQEIQRDNKIRGEYSSPPKKLANKILDSYTGIIPNSTFAGMFGNHDIAMKYISRPICTLNEYIAFRGLHGKKSGTIRADHSSQGKGAVYYKRILSFKPDTGEPPVFDENNFLVSPLPKDLPDTRKDWDTRLINYRTKILFGKLPDSPPSKTHQSPKEKEPESTSTTYAVTGVTSDDVLNVRATSNWRSRKVGELAPDAKGIKRAGPSEQAGSSTWWQITSPSGWVNSRYLKKE